MAGRPGDADGSLLLGTLEPSHLSILGTTVHLRADWSRGILDYAPSKGKPLGAAWGGIKVGNPAGRILRHPTPLKQADGSVFVLLFEIPCKTSFKEKVSC